MIVAHVVFARPQKLHRLPANLLRDGRRFHHVVVGEPAAEPAARTLPVNGDVGFLHAGCGDEKRPSLCRRLGGRPGSLELAVLELRGAVLGLERRVRNERELVRALDDLEIGALERGFRVAIRGAT